MRLLFVLVVFLVVVAPNAHAKRVALVIGNDNYVNVTKLKKAGNDAKAIAGVMGKLGFKVIHMLNVNRLAMDRALTRLSNLVELGDEVLFFFAGHGISVKGQNYLLPIDIPAIAPGQERRVTKEAFSEDEIIEILRERGAQVSILIIDACRNNPFPKAGTRSIGRSVGLGQRVNPPRNTFVMYSAGIGEEALDRLSDKDKNPNSVFTRKLLPLLTQPGLSHVKMAKLLQVQVEELALTAEGGHQQFPAFYDQVRGDYFLTPPSKLSKVARLKTPEPAMKKVIPSQKKVLPDQKKVLRGRQVTVEEHMEFIHEVYKVAGVTKYGLVRSTFASCEGCVPIIIYCKNKLVKPTDIKGLSVVARGRAANFVKTYGDKTHVLLALAEFAPAYQRGLVHCIATGGYAPKYSLNGPLPQSVKHLKLPKSKYPPAGQ